MSQVTGMTPAKLFKLKEYGTQFKITGRYCAVTYDIKTSGEELKKICEENRLNPDNPADFIQLCDIIVHRDILDAFNILLDQYDRTL